MDFTECGFQVIRLTPEYLSNCGWQTMCVVLRDNSRHGSYYFQSPIDPKGSYVLRKEMRKWKWGENANGELLVTIYNKLRNYISIYDLVRMGRKLLWKYDIDIIYACGPTAVLASHFLKLYRKGIKIVARFYGTFSLTKKILGNKVRLMLSIDEVIALALRSDRIIITNDGSQGLRALRFCNKENLKVAHFLVNGVEKIHRSNIEQTYNGAATICRLVSWKHVERGIECADLLVNKYGLKNFVYTIVGDGPMHSSLYALVLKKRLEKNVVFTGAMNHSDAMDIMLKNMFYISTYDISNVGNPLLEAIRAHRIIVTINNGDTGKWIKHWRNGLIYDYSNDLPSQMARDMAEIIINPEKGEPLLAGIARTDKEKLRTWDERLQEEEAILSSLLKA